MQVNGVESESEGIRPGVHVPHASHLALSPPLHLPHPMHLVFAHHYPIPGGRRPVVVRNGQDGVCGGGPNQMGWCDD